MASYGCDGLMEKEMMELGALDLDIATLIEDVNILYVHHSMYLKKIETYGYWASTLS